MATAEVPTSPLFSITIVPPDTSKNFTLFNKECEDLDSEFLMQPVNEADYDSETQICVDTKTGGPSSFYDHFTTKRRKKKFRRGADGPTKQSVRVTAPDITKPPSKEKKEEPRPAAHQDPSLLMLPGTAVPKGALHNAAVRRIACGRMPPTPMPGAFSEGSQPQQPSSNFLSVGTTTFRRAPLPSEKVSSTANDKPTKAEPKKSESIPTTSPSIEIEIAKDENSETKKGPEAVNPKINEGEKPRCGKDEDSTSCANKKETKKECSLPPAYTVSVDSGDTITIELPGQ